VTYQSQDPKQARQIVNAWSTAYEEDSQARATRSIAAAIDYVTTQIETVETDLRQMEQEMIALEQNYIERGVSITNGHGGARMSAIVGQIAQTRVEAAAVQAQIAKTNERLASEPQEIEEVEQQPSHRARAIEEQLSALHVELQHKLQDYYPDSPEVEGRQEQIQRLERELADQSEMTRSTVTTAPNPVYMNAQDTLIRLHGTLDATRARQSALQTQLAEQRSLQAMAPEGSITYSELMRKVGGLQKVHGTLLSRQYELQLKRAMVVPPVQLVKEAAEPRAPVSPVYSTIFGMGLLAAVLLAAFAAITVDQIDDTFAGPDEVRDFLGERLLGVLPEVDSHEAQAVQVGGPDDSGRTAFANSVRMLASTVRIEMTRRNQSSIVVTSSGRAEGKTLVAANLAAALAATGAKVLLVDADLHRPRLHDLFNLEKAPGLSHLLVSEDSADDVAQPTDIENLSVITTGPLPPSPVDLLASSHGKEVIKRLSDAADFVIWDTPPAGFLADATVIGHSTDVALFVVGKRAKRGATRQTLTNLREIGIDIIGVCPNRVSPVGGSYYYYYYYYQDYYGDTQDGKR